jgi:hypothetical protein
MTTSQLAEMPGLPDAYMAFADTIESLPVGPSLKNIVIAACIRTIAIAECTRRDIPQPVSTIDSLMSHLEEALESWEAP